MSGDRGCNDRGRNGDEWRGGAEYRSMERHGECITIDPHPIARRTEFAYALGGGIDGEPRIFRGALDDRSDGG